jgi:hypothetical protein
MLVALFFCLAIEVAQRSDDYGEGSLLYLFGLRFGVGHLPPYSTVPLSKIYTATVVPNCRLTVSSIVCDDYR